MSYTSNLGTLNFVGCWVYISWKIKRTTPLDFITSMELVFFVFLFHCLLFCTKHFREACPPVQWTSVFFPCFRQVCLWTTSKLDAKNTFALEGSFFGKWQGGSLQWVKPPPNLPDIGGIKHDLNHPRRSTTWRIIPRLVVQNQSFLIHKWDINYSWDLRSPGLWLLLTTYNHL